MNWLDPWLLIPAGALLALGLLCWFYRIGHHIQAERARESFRLQHERLEKLFLDKASASGLPRGLRWIACTLALETEFARERKSGQFVALVGATVEFAAIEGGDMEGLPAVPLPRQGTAVFHFVGGEWTTSGRVVFNLAPAEVLKHFASEYEALHQASGGK